MIRENFKGTFQILQLFIRQHWLKILLWILGIVGISVIVALTYSEMYTTETDILGFAITVSNPAMRAILGSGYAVESYNVGAIFANEMLMFSSIALTTMNIMLMSAMTRDDEQAGRLEIIQSLPVGKLSYLVASILLLLFTSLAIIILLTTGLLSLSIDSLTLESTLLYSTILTLTGLTFAGITAVSAQLVETPQSTKQMAFGALFLSFIIRMIGDVQNDTISLFSPLGWTTRTEVFVENKWLPIFVLGIGFILLISLAFFLRINRDLYAGIFPSRKGKKQASTFLKTTPGFILYLQKGKIIGWFLLIFILSGTFGAILGELEVYFADIEILQVFLEGSAGSGIIEQFISYLFTIMSIFTLFPVITIMIGLKTEEDKYRIQHLYTRGVSRNKVFISYFILAILSGVLIQFGISFGTYLTSKSILENPISLKLFVEMSFVYLPAMLFVGGLIAFLVGVVPKYVHSIWLYVTYIFIVLYLGNLLVFPKWAESLSVFNYIPEYPHEKINWFTLILLSLVGLTLFILGLVGYNKRDIES